MDISVIVLGLTLLAAAREYVSLLRQNRRKELLVSAGFMIAAATLGLLRLMNRQLPNPAAGIEAIFGPISSVLDSILQ